MWALVLGRGGFEPPKALGQLIYSQSRLTASVSARPGDFTDNRPMGKRRWILWQGMIAPSMERFVAARTESGFQLSGLILQAHQDAPYVGRYSIEVDEAWRTRAVQVELDNDGRHQIALVTDGAGHWARAGAARGRWRGGGEPPPPLESCLDVDLEWSPSTNTLPIRRLGLKVGETEVVAAAWVRLPSLEVPRLDQSYERTDERRYRYRSGRCTADLAVDEDGMILQYGVSWKAVASSGELG